MGYSGGTRPVKIRHFKATIIFLLILSSLIITSKSHAVEPAYPLGTSWKAKWIWSAEGVAHKDYILYMRKTFVLKEKPRTALVRGNGGQPIQAVL